MKPYDVFISHSSKDSSSASAVKQILQSAGIRCWKAPDEILPGESWPNAILRALASSHVMVLVWSDNSMASPEVSKELTIAMQHNLTVVPLRIENCEPKGEWAFHLVNTHWMDAFEGPLENHLLLLAARVKDILGSMKESKAFLPMVCQTTSSLSNASGQVAYADKSSFRIVRLDDIVRWGWTPASLVKRIIDLDLRSFEGISPEHEGTLTQWIDKWASYPDTWRVIVAEENRIAGYWSTACLFHDDFEKMKSGQMFDGDITPDKLRSFEFPGTYKLYFITICIDTQYRSTGTLRLLLGSFLQVLEDLALDGIYFDEICANAFTPKGESLCRGLEILKLCNHVDSGRIYWAKLLPLPPQELFQSRPRLVELYAARAAAK